MERSSLVFNRKTRQAYTRQATAMSHTLDDFAEIEEISLSSLPRICGLCSLWNHRIRLASQYMHVVGNLQSNCATETIHNIAVDQYSAVFKSLLKLFADNFMTKIALFNFPSARKMIRAQQTLVHQRQSQRL